MATLDPANYKGREQAYIKHILLSSYLSELGYRAGRHWQGLLYIDTHAGPWEESAEDCSDTSFYIGVDTLRRLFRGLRDRYEHHVKACAFLNELDNSAARKYPFDRLKAFGEANSDGEVSITTSNEEFEASIPLVEKFLRDNPNAFRFVMIDPTGWDIPMRSIERLTSDRSSEVLINVMTQDIRRFIDQPDRAESYQRLFGRDDALPAIQKHPKGDRVDAVVREYCKSLDICCDYDYVSSCAILSPERDDIKYFLVYGTNHIRGIEVFKAAETKVNSLQESIKKQKLLEKKKACENAKYGEATLFDVHDCVDTSSLQSDFLEALRDKYRAKSIAKIESLFEGAKTQPYDTVFAEAMAFPLFAKAELQDYLKESSEYELMLTPSKGVRVSPKCSNGDQVVFVG